MVGVCGVDDGVGLAGAVRQDARVVQGSDDRCDPACAQQTGLLSRPDQSADFMPGIAKPFCDGTADVAGGPGDKEPHVVLPVEGWSISRSRATRLPGRVSWAHTTPR